MESWQDSLNHGVECGFLTVSGSCNNGAQWSMWDSVTRSSSFSDQEIIIQKEKEEGAGENDFDNSHDEHSVLTNMHTRTHAHTHTHIRALSKSVLW